MSYSPEYFIARESWRDWRIEARELIRLTRIERGARVLETGCGGGGLLRMLGERGASAVGADTLYVALNLAQANLTEQARAQRSSRAEEISPLRPRSPTPPLSLIQIGTDNHLPFPSNTFDAILGQHVIEHITETNAALREWHRLLKPNGRLALATPNARYPDPAHFADADHAHIFSSPELRNAFTRAGFVVEECFTIFAILSRAFRSFRALGVIGYNLFRRVPYFAERGRTILISARRN